MNKKFVAAGISYEILSNAYQDSAELGLKALLCDGREKPVTKDKKIFKNILAHFLEQEKGEENVQPK